MKITRFRRTATGSPYEIVKPYGGQHIADKLRNIAFLFFLLKKSYDFWRRKTDATQTILQKHILTPWLILSFKGKFCHVKKIQQLHDRRALALRFLCDNSNKSDIRTNLKGIKFGGVSAAHVRPLLSYEISVISLFIILVSFFWLSSLRYVCLSFPLGFIHFNL